MKIFIFILLALVLASGSIYVIQNRNLRTNMAIVASPTVQLSPTSATVPLPTEEDIIRTFFRLINEKRASEAVGMMSEQNTKSDATKQAWGVQFDAIQSISVQSIEPSFFEEWTDGRHTYKVMLDVSVEDDAANAPIPYYGWDNNTNVRWVPIVKEDNLWKIEGLATGP